MDVLYRFLPLTLRENQVELQRSEMLKRQILTFNQSGWPTCGRTELLGFAAY